MFSMAARSKSSHTLHGAFFHVFSNWGRAFTKLDANRAAHCCRSNLTYQWLLERSTQRNRLVPGLSGSQKITADDAQKCLVMAPICQYGQNCGTSPNSSGGCVCLASVQHMLLFLNEVHLSSNPFNVISPRKQRSKSWSTMRGIICISMLWRRCDATTMPLITSRCYLISCNEVGEDLVQFSSGELQQRP